jgi:uncharacterized protein YerC
MIININENETCSQLWGVASMAKMINGYLDMHTVVLNERKLGGAIEAERIKLRTGEEYSRPVITNIDFCGSVFYCLTFVDEQGERMMVHVNDISIIDNPTHKKVCDLNNKYYKQIKAEERINYLKRLCEVNDGACTELFLKEAKMIIDDIGYENIRQEIDLTFLAKNKKIYKIA